MSTAAIAVRHQLSPPGGSSDTIVPNVTVSNSGAVNSKMPHTNHAAASSAAPSSPGDDFGSTDEVKVFKDEGDKEDEQSSGENLLLEEKSSLIDLTESEVSGRSALLTKDAQVRTHPLTNSTLMTLLCLSFPISISRRISQRSRRRDKITARCMVRTSTIHPASTSATSSHPTRTQTVLPPPYPSRWWVSTILLWPFSLK